MTSLSRDEINLLSPAERLTLIGELWDSLTDSQLQLSRAQRSELQSRLQSFDRDKSNAVTWDQLKAELSGRKS